MYSLVPLWGFEPAFGMALLAGVSFVLGWWASARARRSHVRRTEAALGESEERYRAVFDNSGDAIEELIATRIAALHTEYSERQEAVPRPAESESRFRALFEHAPVAIFEVDLTASPRAILRANRQAGRIYDREPGAWNGALLDQIIAADGQRDFDRLLARLQHNDTASVESRGVRGDGRDFPARLSIALERADNFDQVILIVEDISREQERRSEETAIAEERRRIAREIHDGLAQNLASLALRVSLWHTLVDDDPARMHTELDRLQEHLTAEIREVRRSIFALRPVALAELGFYPALERFISEYGEQYALCIELVVEGTPDTFPAHLEPVLFRIVQETLNNIGKHAAATSATITLGLTSPTHVMLSVCDNGRGFNLDTLARAVRRGHIGLKQVSERVESLGGTCMLESRPGAGTTVRVSLPRQ